MDATFEVNSRKCRNAFVTTLKALTKTEVYPFVVRVSKSDKINSMCDIAGGTEILIQSLLTVECAKVRVLPDPEIEENEEEFMSSRRKDGEVYHIPTKCNRQVNFIQTPGERYSSIEQVIKHLPRYVKVEEDTIINPRNNIRSNYVIQAQTPLRLVRKFILESREFLELTDDICNTYEFGTGDRIHFTAVKDSRFYHLYELSRIKLLPRAVMFAQCIKGDIPFLDYGMNREMTDVVKGPLHLLGFTEVKLLVGWVRDKPRRTYETVLIPSDIWGSLLVHKCPPNDTDSYIQRKYGRDRDTNFVEKTMLVLPLKCQKVIWLASPDLFKQRHSAEFRFKAIPTTFEDSSENDTDDTEDITDGCYYEGSGKRIPVTAQLPKVKLKQSLFAKVHAEILRWLRPRRNRTRLKSAEPEFTKASNTHPSLFDMEQRLSNLKHPRRDKTLRSKTFHVNDTKKRTGVYYGNEANVTGVMMSKTSKTLLPRRRGSCDNVMDHEANEPFTKHQTLRVPVVNLKSIEKSTFGHYQVTETENKDGKPLVEETILCGRDNNVAATGVEVEDQTKDGSNFDGYLDMSVDVSATIMKTGCTSEEFYKYSVIQTASCFRLCTLCNLAEQCYINRLDGYFFKRLDLHTLRAEPFRLNSVQILKVYKIIHNGWRPFVE